MTDPAQLEQIVANDPDLRAVFDKMRTAPAYLAPQFAAQLDQLFKSKGIDPTLPNGYGWGADGKVHQQAFMNRHEKLLTALSMVPAGIGIGQGLAAGDLLGPAAGGAGGTLPATTTVGATGSLAPAVGPTTDLAAGTTTAAAGGGGAGILGSLGKYGGVLGDLGNVVTRAAAADAAGRREDAANNARGIAENNAAKVQAAQFNLGLPSVRTNQVARGEVLNTMKDAPLTGDPRIDKFAGGGLIPSAFGPQSRAAGAELSRQAMSGLMNPTQDRLTPQEIPPSGASTLDNIAGGAGLGLDIFSLLSKYGGGMNNGAR